MLKKGSLYLWFFFPINNRGALLDFYKTSAKRKPEQIIIFRYDLVFYFAKTKNKGVLVHTWVSSNSDLVCKSSTLSWLLPCIFFFIDQFRDGVGESQFNQVLNIELEQIIEVCTPNSFLGWKTLVIWTKRMFIFFRPANSWMSNGIQSSWWLLHRRITIQDFSRMDPPLMFLPVCSLFTISRAKCNGKPWDITFSFALISCAGTIVDNTICHPRNNDFYLCAHAGMIVSSLMVLSFTVFFLLLSLEWDVVMNQNLVLTLQGTSRPTHYHVLLDELGFSADDLQQLVHSLCYV